MKAKKIECKIIKKLGVIKAGEYSKEINLVSWAGKNPVYDIRKFSNDENGVKTPLKGISFNLEEFRILKDILEKLDMEEL